MNTWAYHASLYGAVNLVQQNRAWELRGFIIKWVVPPFDIDDRIQSHSAVTARPGTGDCGSS